MLYGYSNATVHGSKKNNGSIHIQGGNFRKLSFIMLTWILPLPMNERNGFGSHPSSKLITTVIQKIDSVILNFDCVPAYYMKFELLI